MISLLSAAPRRVIQLSSVGSDLQTHLCFREPDCNIIMIMEWMSLVGGEDLKSVNAARFAEPGGRRGGRRGGKGR